MTRPAVAVATSAYGADLIRAQGQAHVLPFVAGAGAAAIEIRRELFIEDPVPLLAPLRRAIAAQSLFAIYSAPIELWREDGRLDAPALDAARREAEALEARWLKVSLGHWRAGCDLADLAAWLQAGSVPVAIENDQTAQGGRIAPIESFLGACAAAGLPIGLTFDIGNWRWTGADAAEAARRLGRHVDYVHCKGVVDDGKLKAVPPEADIAAWPALFAQFRPGVMRAIEFPLLGDDLTQVTARWVAALQQL